MRLGKCPQRYRATIVRPLVLKGWPRFERVDFSEANADMFIVRRQNGDRNNAAGDLTSSYLNDARSNERPAK